MSSKTDASGRTRTFQFDHHGSHIAVNVKFRGGLPELKGKQLRRYEILKEESSKLVSDLEQYAYEDVQRQWWDTAIDDAKGQGLGEVYSEGRSGGWLVLKNFTRQYIEDLLETVEEPCDNCKQPHRIHGVGGKCLFEATVFEGGSYTEDDVQEAYEKLCGIDDYQQTIIKSLEYAGQEYLHELGFQVDQAWEQRQQRRADARNEALAQRASRRMLRLTKAFLEAPNAQRRQQAEEDMRALARKYPWLLKPPYAPK